MSVSLRGIATVALAFAVGTGLVAQTALVQPAYAIETYELQNEPADDVTPDAEIEPSDPALPKNDGDSAGAEEDTSEDEIELPETVDPGDGGNADDAADEELSDENDTAVEDNDSEGEILKVEPPAGTESEENQSGETKNEDEAASKENQAATKSKLPGIISDPNGKGNVEAPRIMAGAAAAAGLPSAGFKAGNIISDANMYNGASMTASQIQTFLNQQVSRCTIGDPGRKAGTTWQTTKIATHCLRDLKIKTQSRPANSFCKAYKGANSETAAQMIAKVGAACGISPKVLLVRLQLEQSLVLDTWPTVRQYSFAMGWDCPDSGPGNSANCNNGSAGFIDQVYGSAWQLKRYKLQPDGYRYKAHQTNAIQWHPNASCGTSNVYIENSATAALYIYTPYRPNQSALNAGWGASSNSCATYGNRNFYQYYRAWFGAPNTFFSDVQSSHKYFKQIEWMGTSGISTGTKKTQGIVYEPMNGVTRRAMAAFLYRMSGSPKVTLPAESPFSDVKRGDSFYKEIVWMYQQGLANGYKKAGQKPEYGYMRPVTRGAMAAFLFRLTPGTGSYKAPATPVFADLTKTNQFYREISWMYKRGLTAGYKTDSGKRIYQSGTTVTRQAMAAFLYRLKH